ncbi:MAG: AAA family ATPase [Candidatus Micrarchaeia archaeon]
MVEAHANQKRFVSEYYAGMHIYSVKRSVIVGIEGMPGSGKSTQASMLERRLLDIGFIAKSVHRSSIHNPSSSSIAEYAIGYTIDFVKTAALYKQNEVLILQHTPLFFNYSLGVLIGSGAMPGNALLGMLELFIKPDIVFYLDVPQLIRIERMHKREAGIDRLHEKLAAKDDNEFIEKLKAHYQGRFTVLDGTKSAEEINRHMLAMVGALLRK